jgi:hypothetical protein
MWDRSNWHLIHGMKISYLADCVCPCYWTGYFFFIVHVVRTGFVHEVYRIYELNPELLIKKGEVLAIRLTVTQSDCKLNVRTASAWSQWSARHQRLAAGLPYVLLNLACRLWSLKETKRSKQQHHLACMPMYFAWMTTNVCYHFVVRACQRSTQVVAYKTRITPQLQKVILDLSLFDSSC